MSNTAPKLTGIYQCTVRTYDNDTASLGHTVYVIPGAIQRPIDLGIVDQPAGMPFRPSELLVMAACEVLARDLNEIDQLP